MANFYIFPIMVLTIISPTIINGDNILNLIELDQKSLQTQQSDNCHLSTKTELNEILSSATSKQKYVLIQLKQPTDDMIRFIENSRRTLMPFGYKVCTIDPTISGSISNVSLIIESDRPPVPYYGRHDHSTLGRFIAHFEQRLSQTPYHTIQSKLDKKAYEHIIEPKIISYYPDVSAPGFLEFQKAAQMLAPNPPFFVVHNPQIASKFRLTEPGQLSLVRRLEKSQIFFHGTTTGTTAHDIVHWIQSNRGLVLHELKDTNLFDPELQDANKYQLVAVGEKSSPLGLYFYKILTKTIQNISRENEIKMNPSLKFDGDEDEVPAEEDITLKPTDTVSVDLIRLDDIEIVWVDLSEFPNAALNMRSRYQIPATKNVWFGLIQAPTNAQTVFGLDSVWFDLSVLNLTQSDHQTDQQNIWLVRNWILTVTDRIPLSEHNSTEEPPASYMEPVFLMEPEPVSVREGGRFILECKVQPGLQCSWMKNAQSVQIENSKYRLIHDQQNGDCSLMVSDANPNQDNGEWLCQVETSSRLRQSKQVIVHVRTSSNEL